MREITKRKIEEVNRLVDEGRTIKEALGIVHLSCPTYYGHSHNNKKKSGIKARIDDLESRITALEKEIM